MPTRRRPELARAWVLAAVAGVAAFVLVGNVSGARQGVTDAAANAWRSIFGDRPEAELGSRTIVVLSSPSLADRIEAASGKPGAAQQRQWVADIEAEQDAFLASLRERGVGVDVPLPRDAPRQFARGTAQDVCKMQVRRPAQSAHRMVGGRDGRARVFRSCAGEWGAPEVCGRWK